MADLEIDIWVDCDELGILLAVCTPCLASCIPAMWTEGRLSVREVQLLAGCGRVSLARLDFHKLMESQLLVRTLEAIREWWYIVLFRKGFSLTREFRW